MTTLPGDGVSLVWAAKIFWAMVLPMFCLLAGEGFEVIENNSPDGTGETLNNSSCRKLFNGF
jgi:hypothetical protein